MSITAKNFWQELPTILRLLSTSDYVAVDLEMSGGIHSHHGRHTQQQQHVSPEEAAYTTAREGATRHNLIQLGMTTVNSQNGRYTVKTYTFEVNNMFLEDNKEGWDFSRRQDRVLDFSNSTLNFFRSRGVDPICVEAIADHYYHHGVPYLSRQEHKEAEELANRDFTSRPLIDSELDDKAIVFQDETRESIREWLRKGDKGSDFLTIPFNTLSISRKDLYLRIVRKIVTVECDLCDVIPINDKRAARIRPKDEDRETERRARRIGDLNTAVKRQIGLSIIIEALAGGDFVDLIDPDLILSHPTRGDEDMDEDFYSHREHPTFDSAHQETPEYQQRKQELMDKLRNYETELKLHSPVFVGHNVLYDLCFLYDTFIGELPVSVTDFKDAITRLFPRIIDTKVLALQDDPIEGGDPLNDLFERRQAMCPSFERCYDGREFGPKSSPHHAGYDSYMTAAVFLSLCHKQSDDANRLAPWDGPFWDECRNKIRFGPGVVGSLDSRLSNPSPCFFM